MQDMNSSSGSITNEFAPDGSAGDFDRRSIFVKFFDCLFRKKRYFARISYLSGKTFPRKNFSPNVVRNQKYNIISFLPLVLFEQFRFFFNLYFLIVAITQFIPALKVGT